MRDKIIKIIKNTFALEDGADFQVVSTIPEAACFNKLPELLSGLANVYTSPKELANALEQVVINIKLKREQTPEEQGFLTQVTEIIDKPLYVTPKCGVIIRRLS